MDKKKSILNVSISIISRVILLLVALVVRRLLIQKIGNEANGLNSLYSSIIGTLSVVELGVGRAIVYSMYSPIIAGDNRKVAALYGLYKKLYLTIGAVILTGGLAVMPFLPVFIGDYETITIDVFLTFFLTLVSVVLTYLYSAKSSLIEAYKDNYVTTAILTVARLLRYGLQVAAILIWQSFEAFLVCQIIETILIWIATDIVAARKHGEVMGIKASLDADTKGEIVKNVKAMVMHKIGNILVAGVDSIIISAFIGVTILGKYNNYTYIAGLMAGIIALFFTPLTSVVGHFLAAGNTGETKKWFERFYYLNYVLGMVFFLGYFAVIDDLVELLFGKGLAVSHSVVFVITLNQFTLFMRNATLLFRNASGTFYYDRWKPLFEGALNLVLSLLFVMIFPEDLRIVGVIVATVITTLTICDVVEPYVVYKHVFGQKPTAFYVKNYVYTGLFGICLGICSVFRQNFSGPVAGILVNGFMSVGICLVALGIVAVFDRRFRDEVLGLVRRRGGNVN